MPKRHPREKTNLLCHIFFCWELPIILKVLRKKLNMENFYTVMKKHESSFLGDKLEKAWGNEKLSKKNPSLSRTITRVFLWELLIYGLIHFVSEMLLLIFLHKVLRNFLGYFSDQSVISKTDAYVCAGLFVIFMILYVVTLSLLLLEGMTVGMKIRIACGSLMYRHCLKLSKSNFSEISFGEILNLFSNELKRLEHLCTLLPFILWICPIQLVVSIYIFYVYYGYAALIALATLLLSLLVTSISLKILSHQRKNLAKITDYRIRLMHSIINGIQVIKMYTWEKPFQDLIESTRKSEMKIITIFSYIQIILFSMNNIFNLIAIFLYILVSFLSKSVITAPQVYAFVVVFELVRFLVSGTLPQAFINLVDGYVATWRIEHFLLCNYQSQDFIFKPLNTFQECKTYVEALGIRVKWLPASPNYNLDQVSFKVFSGEFISFVGAPGSGKSTVLQTILKEIPLSKGSLKISGTISYSSQEPWIFPSTVKENIVFKEILDEEKYHKVVKACALKTDFSAFPKGDGTFVGENGIMLSGGQKARLNLARAIYRDADIYLLDDPLAAVDSNVAKHIFEECIDGYLKNKCIILITHHLQYLKKAKRIYLLENGKIIDEGTYDELSIENEHFRHLLKGQNLESERKVTREQDIQMENYVGLNDLKDQVEDFKMAASYKGYFFNSGNWIFFIILVFMFALVMVFNGGMDFLTSFWLNLKENHNRTRSEEDSSVINFFLSDDFMYFYGGIMAGAVVVTFARSYVFVKICIRSAKNLHDKMFTEVIHRSLEFFNSQPIGKVLSRFSKDVCIVDEKLTFVMVDFFQLLFRLIILLILTCIMNPWLIIAMVIFTTAVYCCSVVFIILSRNFNNVEGNYRNLSFSHVSSTLSGLTTVRSSLVQDHMIREFDSFQNKHTAILYTLLAVQTTVSFWVALLGGFYVAAVIFSFFLIKETGASYIGLAIVSAMVVQTLSPFLLNLWKDVDSYMVSVHRLLEYGKKESESEDGITASADWPTEGRITFSSVSLKYKENDPPVLRSISFQVNPREKIGIIGRTGAGKSSLISVLFHLFPFDGQIFIDGYDTKKLSLQSLRSSISIVPQDPFLFPGTLRKNLDPFGKRSDSEIWNLLEEIKLSKVVAHLSCGLETVISDGGSNFSVGQKQLFCLVRAILRQSRIIVLDEATANIDLKTDELIQSTIRKKLQRSTVLTIAHRLTTVMDSDKILVMDAGQVIEFDHPHVLLQNKQGFLYNYVYDNCRETAESLVAVAKESYLKVSNK